jgi:hypothetical protein
VSKEAVVRSVGLDVHLNFCEVALVEDGELRSAGRIATRSEQLELFAQSLGRDDRVALNRPRALAALTVTRRFPSSRRSSRVGALALPAFRGPATAIIGKSRQLHIPTRGTQGAR